MAAITRLFVDLVSSVEDLMTLGEMLKAPAIIA